MATVYCPNCGQPMRKTAMTETLPNGKRIVIYVCPNQSGCKTIYRKET